MHVLYALLCDHASISAEGKLSATGIFDTINVVRFPTVHRDMTLAVQFEGAPADRGPHEILLQVRNSEGRTLSSFTPPTLPLEGPDDALALRGGLIVHFRDMMFERPDEYEIVVIVDSRFLHSVAFNVVQMRIQRDPAA
ncbi:MAG: hypothetical protein ACE5H0_09275 [Bacteroidota bacterium]